MVTISSTLGNVRTGVSKWIAAVDKNEIEVACTCIKTIPLIKIECITRAYDIVESN